MSKPMDEHTTPITYWTQPYPRSAQHAREIAERLREEAGLAKGTFSNEPASRDPLSLEAIRETRYAIRERLLDRLSGASLPDYGYEMPEPGPRAYEALDAEIARMNSAIRDQIVRLAADRLSARPTAAERRLSAPLTWRGR